MMTGTQVCVGIRRIRRIASKPPMPGISISIRTSSGRFVAKRCDSRLAAGDEADLVPVAAQLPADHSSNRGLSSARRMRKAFIIGGFARVWLITLFCQMITAETGYGQGYSARFSISTKQSAIKLGIGNRSSPTLTSAFLSVRPGHRNRAQSGRRQTGAAAADLQFVARLLGAGVDRGIPGQCSYGSA